MTLYKIIRHDDTDNREGEVATAFTSWRGADLQMWNLASQEASSLPNKSKVVLVQATLRIHTQNYNRGHYVATYRIETYEE